MKLVHAVIKLGSTHNRTPGYTAAVA